MLLISSGLQKVLMAAMTDASALAGAKRNDPEPLAGSALATRHSVRDSESGSGYYARSGRAASVFRLYG